MKSTPEVFFNFYSERLKLNINILLGIIITVPILQIDSLVTVYFRLYRAIELHFTTLYCNQYYCKRIACHHKGNKICSCLTGDDTYRD